MNIKDHNPGFALDKKRRDYFTRKIRRWGKENYRYYPWREEQNLYRVLLTEVFLQKTDCKKIRSLYHLIQHFETPSDLFDNIEVLDEIVSRIGLHYKRQRIVDMSLQIMDRFDGKVPGDYRALRSLCGVGDYIANAVLCFGLKQKRPLVDTNTIRIVESFFGYRSHKKRAREDRVFNNILASLLPPRKYVLFNYYLLDFGAHQCVCRKEFCFRCLLKQKCKYFIIKTK